MSGKLYDCIVIGASAGGTSALPLLIGPLPEDFPIPIILVRHMHPHSGPDALWALRQSGSIHASEAIDKEPVTPGVHVAPANYHLLLEKDRTFSLSIDDRVQWARPAVDVLFESAADAYGERLIGIILTGANQDGAAGLRCIHDHGGLTVIQNPETAEFKEMPQAAINACPQARIMELKKIGELIKEAAQQHA